jgi:hypothetical protein
MLEFWIVQAIGYLYGDFRCTEISIVRATADTDS